jgi:ribulose bisphosphate carboxylase small subunit
MEIKATLNRPYSEAERLNFIVEQNHQQGYEIKETETALEAWGYTEEEKQEQEQERIQQLFMTRSDFFDGMIMAFGLDSKELRVIVENVLKQINITPVQIRVALNNYDNALNFYRKHTLFTLINNVQIPISETMYLLFTDEIWDKFFDTKDYKELQKAIHEVEIADTANEQSEL